MAARVAAPPASRRARLGATRGEPPREPARLRAAGAARLRLASGEGGPTAGGWRWLRRGCPSSRCLAIATSRAGSRTRNPGSGTGSAVRARPPAGVPPVPAAPRPAFGRPRRRPAEAHRARLRTQPRNQLTSAGRAVLAGLCPIATTTGRRGLANVAPVAHLAEGVLRRVRSDHLDTADQIAVRAAELGSLRRWRRPPPREQAPGAWMANDCAHQVRRQAVPDLIQPVGRQEIVPIRSTSSKI